MDCSTERLGKENQEKMGKIAKYPPKIHDDYSRFLEEYCLAVVQFGVGPWVPLRLMGVTGLIAWELMDKGWIFKDGDLVSPAI